jgi:hypothetical protein
LGIESKWAQIIVGDVKFGLPSGEKDVSVKRSKYSLDGARRKLATLALSKQESVRLELTDRETSEIDFLAVIAQSPDHTWRYAGHLPFRRPANRHSRFRSPADLRTVSDF